MVSNTLHDTFQPEFDPSLTDNRATHQCSILQRGKRTSTAGKATGTGPPHKKDKVTYPIFLTYLSALHKSSLANLIKTFNIKTRSKTHNPVVTGQTLDMEDMNLSNILDQATYKPNPPPAPNKSSDH